MKACTKPLSPILHKAAQSLARVVLFTMAWVAQSCTKPFAQSLHKASAVGAQSLGGNGSFPRFNLHKSAQKGEPIYLRYITGLALGGRACLQWRVIAWLFKFIATRLTFRSFTPCSSGPRASGSASFPTRIDSASPQRSSLRSAPASFKTGRSSMNGGAVSNCSSTHGTRRHSTTSPARPFHCGKNDRDWRASLGWLLKSSENVAKALDLPEAPKVAAPVDLVEAAERTAALYRRMGRDDDAAEAEQRLARLRRGSTGPPRPIGQLVAGMGGGP